MSPRAGYQEDPTGLALEDSVGSSRRLEEHWVGYWLWTEPILGSRRFYSVAIALSVDI